MAFFKLNAQRALAWSVTLAISVLIQRRNVLRAQAVFLKKNIIAHNAGQEHLLSVVALINALIVRVDILPPKMPVLTAHDVQKGGIKIANVKASAFHVVRENMLETEELQSALIAPQACTLDISNRASV